MAFETSDEVVGHVERSVARTILQRVRDGRSAVVELYRSGHGQDGPLDRVPLEAGGFAWTETEEEHHGEEGAVRLVLEDVEEPAGGSGGEGSLRGACLVLGGELSGTRHVLSDDAVGYGVVEGGSEKAEDLLQRALAEVRGEPVEGVLDGAAGELRGARLAELVDEVAGGPFVQVAGRGCELASSAVGKRALDVAGDNVGDGDLLVPRQDPAGGVSLRSVDLVPEFGLRVRAADYAPVVNSSLPSPLATFRVPEDRAVSVAIRRH